MALEKDYASWDQTRTAIWEAEENGFEGSEYSSDDMGWSDDEGVDLLRRYQPITERFAQASQRVIDCWESGNLAEAVNVLNGVLYDYRNES